MKNILVLLTCLLIGLTTKSFAQGKEVWKDVPYPKEANGNIKCIETDPQGNVWVGTEYGSLLKFDGKTWVSIDLKASMIEKWKSRSLGKINTIYFGKNNTIWIGTDLTAFYFNGYSWNCMWNTRFTNFVPAIYKILQLGNSIWMSGAKGIYKLEDSKWTVYSMAPAMLRQCKINGVLKDISSKDPLDTILYDLDTNLTIPGKSILDMEFDNDSNLWYATDKRGLVKFN